MPIWGLVTIVCSVGSLLVVIITLYNKGIFWLGQQLTTFRHDLTKHADTLVDHSKRMTTTEERYIQLLTEFRTALAEFRADLQGHARTLSDHQGRMVATEERYITLAQDMQRLIGRTEFQNAEGKDQRSNLRTDRRHP